MEASSPLRSSSSGSKPADAAAIKNKGLGSPAQATLRRLRQAGHVLDGSGGELTVEIRKLLALLRQYAGLALSGDTTFVVLALVSVSARLPLSVRSSAPAAHTALPFDASK